MNFPESLSKYVNETVEVYLPNQTPVGRLDSVNGNSIVVEVRNGSYVTPSEFVTIFLDNVEGVRVVNEVN
ncbi:hypothetical protein HF078_02310 [Bacillus sp. RO2]|uniref:hypothetical protein n=1 Tax=Bacillus sp. RO2 TaxID=2723913 RepID=UPI00145CD65E|nr:hypothetical protein [Bacillus sp. RO2]NMH71899.1 hypothetical protein [Bacillus sp. RO2]